MSRGLLVAASVAVLLAYESGTVWAQQSASCGVPTRGRLVGAMRLPPVGDGYAVPEPWRIRGRLYGTPELVGLVQRVAATVRIQAGGGTLGVADLSARNGGPVSGHRSHQNGRDVDLLYYSLTAEGESMPPDGYMPQYRLDGSAVFARAPVSTNRIPTRYFDVKRNWLLVKSLLGDSRVRVTRLLVAPHLEDWLLRYGSSIGESQHLLHRAAEIMGIPKGVRPHDDHMHVQIACASIELQQGLCLEEFRTKGELVRARKACSLLRRRNWLHHRENRRKAWRERQSN